MVNRPSRWLQLACFRSCGILHYLKGVLITSVEIRLNVYCRCCTYCHWNLHSPDTRRHMSDSWNTRFNELDKSAKKTPSKAGEDAECNSASMACPNSGFFKSLKERFRASFANICVCDLQVFLIQFSHFRPNKQYLVYFPASLSIDPNSCYSLRFASSSKYKMLSWGDGLVDTKV